MSASKFDYIIVGAGSAGCVLANRLSADGRYSVLVLEAGPRDRYPWIHVPIGYGKTMFHTGINWGYWTEADPGIAGRSMYWPRGKVLGGSSSINGLIYIRGQHEDFNDWVRLGNEGWSWQDVLPYFRRSERQQRGADDYHGDDGPLSVSDIPERNELCDAFIAAGQEIDIPRNDDFNGATQEGVGYFQLTVRNGRRCSAAVAFLRPAMERPNLHVETDALCERVLLQGGRAVGVRYRQGGRTLEARAGGEVIIASGAINSPQILELSGIGDPAVLGEHGIPVNHALPGVGGNLQDHLQARLILRCTRAITTNDDLHSFARRMRIGLRYLLRRRGPLAVGINQAGGFARSDPELHRPDIQFHFGTLSSDVPGSPVHRFPGFTVSTCQLRPTSSGSVHLRTNDPAQYPSIRPNYLATDEDCRVMVNGVKLARRLVAAASLRPYIAAEYSPGPDAQSDDALLEFVRRDATTIFHPAGTCRMGNDGVAVVDPRLRVHGIEGLRVADCSVMPKLISGNTNAAAIMIGEKAADMILADALRGHGSHNAAA
ncbi:GMC family oxidoreductase [Arhodomonas sp. SL1]|uniref:GMC family oxidoreductase n=1 Tax=Arhodomonas sp. SL1 TaxID=3425691 RepID=UPI003F8841C3